MVQLEGTTGRARFSKAEWFVKMQNLDVIVIGAGGIGSWLGHFLARAGAKPIIQDMDSYDINNIGGQLCTMDSLHKNKAESLKNVVDIMLGPQNNTMSYIPHEFTNEQVLLPITFCCVDSMRARRTIYDSWLSLGDDREIFIDGRMGAEASQVFTATKDKDNYLENWFPDIEADIAPCAYKATSHIGSMTASYMMNVLTNYLSNDNRVPDSIIYYGEDLNMEIK